MMKTFGERNLTDDECRLMLEGESWDAFNSRNPQLSKNNFWQSLTSEGVIKQDKAPDGYSLPKLIKRVK